MPSNVLGTLICYILVSSFTPGPGNILSMNTMIQYNWQKGKSLIAGICCGYACVQFLCTIMLYELNSYLEPAMAVLKYIGTGYMLWLGIHIMREIPVQSGGEGKASFSTGFFLQLVNVKIYFYITTLLTVYLIPYLGSLSSLIAAGASIVCIGSLASLTWAFLA